MTYTEWFSKKTVRDLILNDSWKSEKKVSPQESLISISELQQQTVFLPQLPSLNSPLVPDFFLSCPYLSWLNPGTDNSITVSVKLPALVPELPQQQGLRDKHMKNQSDNGVLKIGITGAEDVMASLMLLLSIAQILLSLWTVDLTLWKGSFAAPIVQRKGEALSTDIFKAQGKHKAKR